MIDKHLSEGTGESLTHLLGESLDALEITGVLEEVASYAYSTPGKATVLASEPETERALIEYHLKLVGEFRELVSVSGPIGLADLVPLEGLLSKLENPATILESEEILVLRDVLVLSDSVLARLAALEDRFALLGSWAGRLNSLGMLVQRVAQVIDQHGMVRSDASPGLERIRRRTHRVRSSMLRKLEAVVQDRDLSRIVQEDYVTIRNDRFVILLRPEFKGLLDGIIHDHSRSGASVYVEPLDVVELNNEVASLADEERDEIRRIFAELTGDFRDASTEIRDNYLLLAQLDAYQARARYAERYACISPVLVENGFRIVGARHPLLLAENESEVVPMDVRLDSGIVATVISGANMGGKTVALKIAGLFPLMTRCAILLPAFEGTEIEPFTRIMADIGDDQDIRGKVSSFSGHMQRIRTILDEAEAGDLVLLDELGGATDPDEGSALAMAILDELIERQTKVVVTTHLTHLKAYAMGMEVVQNVSVEFHPVTLKPTYRLLYDLPGESHAIATAERIGLSPNVLSRARGYMDRSAGGSAKLMQRLREKLERLDTERMEMDRLRQVLEAEVREAQSARQAAAEEFRRDARDAIKKAERQLAELQRAVKSGRIKDKQEPRKVVESVKQEVVTTLGVPLEKERQHFPEGARVTVISLNMEGIVLRTLENGRIEVALGNVKSRLDADDLYLLDAEPAKKSASQNEQVRVDIPSASPRREVNVIGLRVHEALPVVDKALDSALLSGLSSVTIVHGKGTGRLKRAIREHLSEHSLVSQFRAAGARSGGEGATEVELVTE